MQTLCVPAFPRNAAVFVLWRCALWVCALFLSGCAEPAKPLPTGEVAKSVYLYQVNTDMYAQMRRFPAVVEATQTAELAFRVGGELEQLPLRPGQNVERGQLVAAIDATDYEVALDQAEAQVELIRAQFLRSERMIDQQLISQAAFDQARADLRVAEANLRSAQTNLQYTQLKAPFSGVIAHMHVENYENVAPQQPIMTLQVDGYIDVSIQVPERLFARVRRDLEYQPDVVFDSLPGQSFKASIREWDRIADAATNTYRVVFTMPAPLQTNILPGMTATVLIDAAQMTERVGEVMVLPASAVFNPEQRPIEPSMAYVWVYHPYRSPQSESQQAERQHDGGTLHLRQVQIGDMTNQGVEVVAGIEAGEYIVQAGVHHLHEGQKVVPWLRERGL